MRAFGSTSGRTCASSASSARIFFRLVRAHALRRQAEAELEVRRSRSSRCSLAGEALVDPLVVVDPELETAVRGHARPPPSAADRLWHHGQFSGALRTLFFLLRRGRGGGEREGA
jgi:hypothetical protein